MNANRSVFFQDKFRLHHLLRSEFSGMRLIAVSNREPYIHQRGPSGIECIQPASGLATALDPILRATGGTWVAHGSGSADREVVDARNRFAVPPERPEYTLRRVWLDRDTEQRYYYGLANEGLWPLCHIAFQRPKFRLSDWQSYREANEIFADAVVEEAADDPAVVFIQDYHFGLLPRMLRERNPKLVIAQFWHIPWPNREVFRVFPWSEELLDGLLGNDVLGFHLQSHCTNFLETVDRGLEARVDTEHSMVHRHGGLTRVLPFPISIDFDKHVARSSEPAIATRMAEWRRRLQLGNAYFGIGIDRADYTKGIPERLRAIDRLLDTCPEYRGRLVFLQVAVPSRTPIAEYQHLNDELKSLAEEINAKWSRAAGWRPIRLYAEHFPQEDLMALHRLADFCLVTSLHDGMNLVAKEFVASRIDENGVLILSNFAGAATELTYALLVNPFSPDHIAEAIQRALAMPHSERASRMRGLRRVVSANNIYSWAGRILQSVADAAEAPWQVAATAASTPSRLAV
jgi:alpha,alpha-trehalose-phosphate synthase [UDP-forming]